MSTAPSPHPDDSVDSSSPEHIAADDRSATPAPGSSGAKQLRKRERTWIILLLLLLALAGIELFDHFVGIPNR